MVLFFNCSTATTATARIFALQLGKTNSLEKFGFSLVLHYL